MARAYGKLILAGEHAVVYGYPAIAVPLDAVYVDVDIQPTKTNGIRLFSEHINTNGIGLNTDDQYAALTKPVKATLQYFAISPEPNFKLSIHSTIPIASGFGSGAALATALIRSIADYVGQTISKSDLNALVYDIEKLHHGTPSGIDNTVIVYEQPVYFERGKPLQTFSIAQDFDLLIGHVGYATSTYETVGAVRQLYDANTSKIEGIFAKIRTLVEDTRTAIESGDLPTIGTAMNQNHDYLRQLQVSDATLDRLCQVARKNGAWGAKLSGGGRGGNFIALVPPQAIDHCKKALLDAGAQNIIHTTIKAQPSTP